MPWFSFAAMLFQFESLTFLFALIDADKNGLWIIDCYSFDIYSAAGTLYYLWAIIL